MYPALHRETSRKSLVRMSATRSVCCSDVAVITMYKDMMYLQYNLYILYQFEIYIYIYIYPILYDLSKIYGRVMLCHNFGDLTMPKVLLPGCWRSWALKGGCHGAEIRIFMKRGNTFTDTYSFL